MSLTRERAVATLGCMNDVRIPVRSSAASIWNILAGVGCVALGIVLIALPSGGQGSGRYAGPAAIGLGALALVFEVMTRRKLAKVRQEIVFGSDTLRMFDPGELREVEVRYEQITEAQIITGAMFAVVVRWNDGARIAQVGLGSKLFDEKGIDQFLAELERRSITISGVS